ncbi:hypothetical protein Tco_1169241 [Tanacetum coccineum]
MGPSVYPPAQQNPQPFYRPDYQFGYPRRKGKTFNGGYGEYYNSQWTLPLVWTESGVMLVLPADPGLWSEVIFSRGYGEYYNSQWTLPPAWIEFGVMLMLPADPGLWSEVISR